MNHHRETMARELAVVALVALCGLSACAPKTLRMASRISHFAATYEPTPGEEMADALADLQTRLTTWGITLGDLPPTSPNVGVADAHGKTILIRAGLSVNARFEVLAHEAGHLLQPPSMESGSMHGQVFAEMVGVGVQKFYGSKTAEKVAAAYLAQMKYAFPAYKWMKHDIDYAIRCLTGQEPLPKWRDSQ
jgi:hypothetical protein